LVAAILIFGSPLAFVLHKIPQLLTGQLVFLGFVLMFVSMFWMFKSTPTGAAGRPMKKYWNSHPKTGNTEAIYVCEESKTYFIRVWGRSSRDDRGKNENRVDSGGRSYA
jgi:hypothetical protein